MKKIMFLFISLLFLTGCSKGKLVEIDFEDYDKKVSNGDTFVLVIGATGCNYCLNYRETLKEMLKDYDIELYYIDKAKFTEVENSKFLARINFDNNNIVTPTTVYIENGHEKSKYDRITGAASASTVIKYLKEKGIINESK